MSEYVGDCIHIDYQLRVVSMPVTLISFELVNTQ